MAEKLTPQQEMAVTDRGGKLLVSAAAGSGKTKVLVERLLSYISDPVNPANIDDFLMITYTKAAAAELRGKIADKLTQRIAQDPENRHLQQQMQRLYMTKISTVHAFCGDILREYAYRLDLPADFRVAEENECTQLREQVMEQLLEDAYGAIGEDPELQCFVDTQGFGRDDRKIPQIITQVYNSARCHLDPEGWLDRCLENADPTGMTDAGQTPWGAYLIGQLRELLGRHIAAMERCAQLADQADGLEKPASLLRSNVELLRNMAACTTWDGFHNMGKPDFGKLLFPRKYPDTELTDRIKAVRNFCKDSVTRKLKNFSDSSEQVLADLAGTAPAVRGLIGLVRRFASEYDKIKRSRRVLDFGDLEHKMLDLLLGKRRSGRTALAKEIGERFREIMVDEYQDSNQVQDAIFTALTEDRRNCFMVGDVKQSIYQFRLADPGIFLKKYREFVPAETARDGQDRKVLLSRNFRSAGQVISAVNDVFCSCMSPEVGGLAYGADEMLYEGIPHIPQQEPEVELYAIDVREDTYQEEAAFTAQRVSELLDGTHFVREQDRLRPIVPDDIVILLRSPGSVGAEFQYALEQRGIRCQSDRGEDLLQTPEIATLRALLQTVHNPLQDIPLTAVLASPVFGFSADLLAAIRAGNTKCPFIEAVKAYDSDRCRAFLSILDALRQEARMNDVNGLLQRVFVLTRIDSIYGATVQAQEKNENLQAFCKLAADWTGHKDLGEFLDYLESLDAKGVNLGSDQKTAGAVTVMSIHKSKGLEFPVVFLCGLSKGFNHESAREQVLCHKELGLGMDCVNTAQRVRYPTAAKRAIAEKMVQDTVSEELRVLYVAMTRARDRLIMTYADGHLDKRLSTLAQRMDLSDPVLLTGEVSCPGTWILYTALMRTEAGELFARGGKPDCSRVSQNHWLIRVTEAPQTVEQSCPEQQSRTGADGEAVERIRKFLSFRYPYQAATVTPSKQTATQLKGREKDQEAAENTWQQREHTWRKPVFREAGRQGTDYGTAMHGVMQHIRFGDRMDYGYIRQELARMEENGDLTSEQGRMVDIGAIARFFASDLGHRIASSGHVLREFKFSILVDADGQDPALQGEQILLQGVVDCAVEEPDGLIILDFKTDYVTEETLARRVQRYAPQVRAYAEAMSRIFGKPVKQTLLYFFHLNRFAEV